MKFYRADLNGLEYDAIIRETSAGYFGVSVTARPPYGNRYPDWEGKKGGYKSAEYAFKALKRHYPDAEWRELA